MRHARLTVTLATALVLGACSRSTPEQPLADDLQRDLAMTAGTAVELAPKSGGQQIVSAIERMDPIPTPARQRVGRAVDGPGPKSPAVKKVEVGLSEPSPEITAQVPVPVADTVTQTAGDTPTESPVGAGRPTPVPTQRRAPAGGWKTPGEVIRNAPFPINPLTNGAH